VGPAIIESFQDVGVFWDKCTKDRHAAADQIRWRLARRTGHPTLLDENKKPLLCIPGIRWFSTCTAPIRSIPSLPADENDPEVPDTKADDHNYDSMSYACMSRVMPADKDRELVDWWDEADDLEAARRKRRTVGQRSGYIGGW
jgi:hypothetical protein